MSVSSESEVSGEGDWDDVESDTEVVSIVSLFGPEVFPSTKAMLEHCQAQHQFDFIALVRTLKLDFHGAVKLVNLIRGKAKAGQAVEQASIGPKDLEDDALLKPVLDNDALLFSLDEVLEEIDENEESSEENDNQAGATAQTSARTSELEKELETLRNQFNNYRLAVEETLDKRWEAQPELKREKTSNANYYFESYAEHEIHETMLKDAVRTNAYRDFIYDNKHLFKDKVVLDIGCGTGILSMFAAKAGAKQVIAVDNSDIIAKAMENIFNNGLSSQITCIKGAIEEVILPVQEVDIIISEWMGYCLLYEAMLPSVLFARDKYLKPDGILAPSSATIWMAPVADPEFVADHISFWRDVYGFDMKAMQVGIYDDCRVQTMPANCLAGTPFPFKVLDLHTVKVEELQFTAKWTSKLTRDIDSLDGFLIWFDNFFATSRSEPMPADDCTPDQWTKQKSGNVAFTTGPDGIETHWRQGLLMMPPAEDTADIAAGTTVSGTIRFKAADDNVRALLLDTEWTVGERKQSSRSWKLK